MGLKPARPGRAPGHRRRRRKLPVDWSLAAVVLLVGGGIGWLADRQRALRSRITQYNDLVLDLLCVARFDGYFEWVNPAWERTLGYTTAELLSRPFADFVHPDERAATQMETSQLAEGTTDAHKFRNRYRAADGSYRWLEWNTRVVAAERRFYAAARDITVQKEAEEALDDEAARLEVLVQRRTVDLNESRIDLLHRLALAAEYRDDNTYEHTERVGRNAALIARELALPEKTVALIRHAAPLHDIGKLGVSDSILLKPDRLTVDERQRMQEHTTIGARILGHPKFAVVQMAQSIALNHHEHWDGNGYPRGLRGTEVPLSSRIVAVADAFDALTHQRPYKEAWPLATTLAEIQRLSERQFDPQVAGALAALDHELLLSPVESYDLDMPPPPLKSATEDASLEELGLV